MRVRLAGVLAIAALGLATGCGSTSEHAIERVTRSTTTVAATTTGVPGPSLEDALVTTVPSGFTMQPDDVGDTGPSDLDKAVRDDGSADARATLVGDGFVRGYQRLWATDDGERQIIVFVYQFETSRGAVANTGRTVERLRAGPGVSDTFTLDGVPGSGGVVGNDEDTAGASLVFSVGVYEVQVVANGPVSDSAQSYIDAVTPLARAQYDKLA
ncbi:MAG: hypothetical protein U0Q22_17500 [Acidimicrobiales bacterium]